MLAKSLPGRRRRRLFRSLLLKMNVLRSKRIRRWRPKTERTTPDTHRDRVRRSTIVRIAAKRRRNRREIRTRNTTTNCIYSIRVQEDEEKRKRAREEEEEAAAEGDRGDVSQINNGRGGEVWAKGPLDATVRTDGHRDRRRITHGAWSITTGSHSLTPRSISCLLQSPV